MIFNERLSNKKGLLYKAILLSNIDYALQQKQWGLYRWGTWPAGQGPSKGFSEMLVQTKLLESSGPNNPPLISFCSALLMVLPKFFKCFIIKLFVKYLLWTFKDTHSLCPFLQEYC